MTCQSGQSSVSLMIFVTTGSMTPPPPIEGPGQVALSWAKRKNCPGGQEQAGTGSGGGIPAVRFLPPQQVSRVASCYENIRFHTFAYKFCSVFFEMNKIEKKIFSLLTFFDFCFRPNSRRSDGRIPKLGGTIPLTQLHYYTHILLQISESF